MILPTAAYLASISASIFLLDVSKLTGLPIFPHAACAFLVAYCAAQSTDLEFGAFTNPYFCRKIQHTSYWLQFVMACVATTLIGYKTWYVTLVCLSDQMSLRFAHFNTYTGCRVCQFRRYRRMVKTLIGKETTWRSPVSKAMLIMLDTGLIYALFFVCPSSAKLSDSTVLTHAPSLPSSWQKLY